MGEDVRIGVFICHCGGNISQVIDVERARAEVSRLEGVVTALDYEHLCSKAGLDMIKNVVKEFNLNRVVVASCSPLMHLQTFRSAAEEAGLNPYLLEMVNIREHDSWVHSDKEKATLKAIDLIRGAVMRAKRLEALTSERRPVKQSVLVVGGGVAGIFASLDLASKGYQVYLIDKAPSIGGHMMQLSKTFPTLDCSTCILAPRMVEVARNPNIKLMTLTTVENVEGYPGDFKVTLRVKPRFVDVEKCVACGECSKVCPVTVPSEFDEGLTKRKAIYQPFPQAVPSAYTIDPSACKKCGACTKVCKGKAINLDDKEKIVEINVGAIIIATGYDLMKPNRLELGYGQHPDIITNLQFERLFVQGIVKPSNGKMPSKVAFILCVGSRDPHRGVPYCSKICCMIALKQALILKEMVPGSDAWIFYTDIRASGKWYEEFYAKAREHGVKFIRGRVAEVIPEGDKLIVKAEDTSLGVQLEEEFDMVVLSPALLPPKDLEVFDKLMGIGRGPDGFLVERHYKLDPVDSTKSGIYACGCVLGPKDVRESVVEALAASAKVSSFLGKGETTISPEVAFVIEDLCNGCGQCLEKCPTKAITITNGKATISSLSCIGCGLCIPSCPTSAIDLKNNTNEQLMAKIAGIAQGSLKPKIIAFAEKTTAYRAIDMYGLDRRQYSPSICIVEVPSCGRITIRHVAAAFAYGADGVLFIEGEDSPLGVDGLRDLVNKFRAELRKFGVEAGRFMTLSITLPQYYKLSAFDTFANRIEKMRPISEEVKAKLKEAFNLD